MPKSSLVRNLIGFTLDEVDRTLGKRGSWCSYLRPRLRATKNSARGPRVAIELIQSFRIVMVGVFNPLSNLQVTLGHLGELTILYSRQIIARWRPWRRRPSRLRG